MIVDPSKLSRGDVYRFLTRAVVPRPIAFVSTISRSGLSNVAPFSYFNALSAKPPLLGVSIADRDGQPKDTLRNIRETEEFVINIVPEALAERMVKSSGDWPDDVSEFGVTGLTELPADRVRAPRVGESPIHLECRLDRIIDLGSGHFVVGEMLCAHVSDDVLTDGRVDAGKLRPVGRLGGDEYSIVRDVLHLSRPAVTPPGGRQA